MTLCVKCGTEIEGDGDWRCYSYEVCGIRAERMRLSVELRELAEAFADRGDALRDVQVARDTLRRELEPFTTGDLRRNGELLPGDHERERQALSASLVTLRAEVLKVADDLDRSHLSRFSNALRKLVKP